MIPLDLVVVIGVPVVVIGVLAYAVWEGYRDLREHRPTTCDQESPGGCESTGRLSTTPAPARSPRPVPVRNTLGHDRFREPWECESYRHPAHTVRRGAH